MRAVLLPRRAATASVASSIAAAQAVSPATAPLPANGRVTSLKIGATARAAALERRALAARSEADPTYCARPRTLLLSSPRIPSFAPPHDSSRVALGLLAHELVNRPLAFAWACLRLGLPSSCLTLRRSV